MASRVEATPHSPRNDSDPAEFHRPAHLVGLREFDDHAVAGAQITRAARDHRRIGQEDLRRTTFLDSTGLLLVLDAHSAAAAAQTEFAIIAGPPCVQRTFEVAGLNGRVPFIEPGSQSAAAPRA